MGPVLHEKEHTEAFITSVLSDALHAKEEAAFKKHVKE